MFEKLVDIICSYVEVEKENIHPESRFMEDLGFTSYDFMSMLGEIEDEFDVEIEQTEAMNIRTVQEAVDYLENSFSLLVPFLLITDVIICILASGNISSNKHPK